MPFHWCSWVLIPQLPLFIFPSTHFRGLYKIQYGRFSQVKCVVQGIRLVSEPVTNSLVVPVKSEGSLLALIKFSKFIFSPGMGVMPVEVIILFVCQLVIFCYQWGVAVLHPAPVVCCHLFLHYLATYYSFYMWIETLDPWGGSHSNLSSLTLWI